MRPQFGGAFDAAAGAAVTSGGELALKAGAAFLDSAIGKILITLVAGIITGGAGAAIVGPILAAIGPTLPAMLIGETTFLSDWVADMTAYTNSPLVLQVPGLSDVIGADTGKAMLHIQESKIGPKQKEIDRRVQEHDFQGGFLSPPEEYAAWYRTMMLEVIGSDFRYAGTPEELAAKLHIRQDSAAMAIAVWNGTKLPDMSKYDPYTGLPKNQFFSQQGLSGNTTRALSQAIAMQSAKTGISTGVKTGVLAAEAAPPTTMSAKAAPTLAAQAAIRETRSAAPAVAAPAPASNPVRDAAPVVAGVAAGAIASVAAGLAIGPVIAIGAGVALLTRYALKR